MDTYGHLLEGSDRAAADKMEKLFAPKERQQHKRPPQMVPKKAS
jgi:hypothetical protein